MNRRSFMKLGAAAGGVLIGTAPSGAARPDLTVENKHFSLSLDPAAGSLSSLVVKRNQSELIGEKRLLASFRICLPLPDYQCNYIEGAKHKPVAVNNTGSGFSVRFPACGRKRANIRSTFLTPSPWPMTKCGSGHSSPTRANTLCRNSGFPGSAAGPSSAAARLAWPCRDMFPAHTTSPFQRVSWRPRPRRGSGGVQRRLSRHADAVVGDL